MANTYELIASQLLTTTTASITFSSIPSTYTDLKIVASVRSNGASEDYSSISINGVTTGFTSIYVQGNGSSASSGSLARWGGNYSAANNTANTFGSAELYFPNYLSSTYKSYSVDNVTETNGTTAYAGLVAGLWSNTSAISSITLTANGGSYVAYSNFYLYGIKNS